MTVLANKNAWDASNVLYRNHELLAYNKQHPTPEMHHIDYSLGVLNAQVFQHHAHHQFFDLAELYQQLSQDHQLAGYEVHQRFYEIGSPQGLIDTEHYLLGKDAHNLHTTTPP